MTLIIELAPDAEARIRARALAEGRNIEDIVRDLIAALPDMSPPTEYEATRSLFEQWAAEDAAMSDEKHEQAERDWAAFRAGMNATRAAEGRPPAYS